MRHTRIFACLAAISLPTTAAADLVYEGFSYTQGSSLSGQNGGAGWGAAWNSSQSALGVNVGPGLNFGGLATEEGAASSDPATTGSVAFYTRQLGATYGADNTTIFISVLLRPDTGFGFYGGINLEGVFIGKSGTAGTYGIEDSTNNVSSSSEAPVAGTTVLLVLRADFLPGNDHFSLYIDPTPGLAEPATADALKTNFDLLPASFIFLNNAGGWTTDEIRIGSTFASVTPQAVPEPSSLILVAWGLGTGFALRSRRRPAAR
jgi:hypothetical protein